MAGGWPKLMGGLLALLHSLGLAGCASYTVMSTHHFVDAARNLNQVVAQADSARMKADDAQKEMRIAQSAGSCTVSSASLYVRRTELRKSFIAGRPGIEAVLRQATGGTLAPACEALKACEQGPARPDCDTVCYSSSEASCLTQLSRLAVNPEIPWNAADLNDLRTLLADVQYPSTTVVRTQAEQETLALIGEYLDLLSTAATPQATRANRLLNEAGLDLNASLKTDFTDLANRVSDARDKYAQVSRRLTGLPTIEGLSAADMKQEGAALGTLAEDLNEIVQQYAEAKSIAQVVRKHQADVRTAILGLGDDIASDVVDAYTKQANFNQTIRNAYQQRFDASHDAIARERILVELRNYPAPDQNSVAAARAHQDLTAAVNAAAAAHDALVELIVDPTAADKRAALKSALTVLQGVLQDVRAVLAGFH